ncbi:MAG: hypothetical protein LUH47_10300 [Clostridiales bacterium]|nr:hypothetical protein [Clostridiales bacterium]
MIDQNDERIQKIADFYGWESQGQQCIEETAELTKAINKFYRFQNYPELSVDDDEAYDEVKEGLLDDIVQEISDVEICIAQLKYLIENYFMYSGKPYTNVKIQRELRRIDKFTKKALEAKAAFMEDEYNDEKRV